MKVQDQIPSETWPRTTMTFLIIMGLESILCSFIVVLETKSSWFIWVIRIRVFIKIRSITQDKHNSTIGRRRNSRFDFVEKTKYNIPKVVARIKFPGAERFHCFITIGMFSWQIQERSCNYYYLSSFWL